LLIAVSLLALAGALLAGAMASARAAARAESSREASLLADAESRVVIAGAVQGWTPADDSLPIGAAREHTIGPRRVGSTGAMASTKVRIQRLAVGRYVIATDCEVGADTVVLARRRMQLLLERVVPADTTAAMPRVAPIARWSMSDLFL
jgi:hypothetical protein